MQAPWEHQDRNSARWAGRVLTNCNFDLNRSTHLPNARLIIISGPRFCTCVGPALLWTLTVASGHTVGHERLRPLNL